MNNEEVIMNNGASSVGRFITYSLLLITSLWFSPLHGQETPVMLFLNDHDQDDSLGFNLVHSLSSVVYDQVVSGKVVLWDSPKKEEQIKPKSLLQIEKYSETFLKDASQLFIYETWIKNKKDVIIKPFGLYFSTKKADGEVVIYGFVEYSFLDSILNITPIPLNANGNCYLTYGDVLKQKLYYYNVVQYGDQPITKPEEALNIKNELVSYLPAGNDSLKIECKTIKYSIENIAGNNDKKIQQSKSFLKAIDKYFEDNPEFYLNLGGDYFVSYQKSNKYHVTKAEIEERWIRNTTGVYYVVTAVTIYVNDRPLNVVPSEEFNRWDLTIMQKPVNDFLKEKEFYFRILKINGQEINPDKASAYLDALKNCRWNQLNQYVKYQ